MERTEEFRCWKNRIQEFLVIASCNYKVLLFFVIAIHITVVILICNSRLLVRIAKVFRGSEELGGVMREKRTPGDGRLQASCCPARSELGLA